ncbi:MAG: PilZ domain-containing protein [Candidatus Omnitrophica bacterium]|nr:PilZ domain-containing protein [Candidatus Omnitrophota bacterium]
MYDRRMFERYKVDFPVEFFCKQTNKRGEGRLIDISAGGGGLILTNEVLSAGEELEMWIDLADNKEPLYINGIVIWSKKIEPTVSRIGVEFEKINFMNLWRILKLID